MLKHFARLLGGSARETHRAKEAMSTSALTTTDLDLVVPMIKGISARPSEHDTKLQLPFEQTPVSQVFVADMVVMYAVDRPTHLEYVSNAVAQATGLRADQLHRKAISNLPTRLGQVQLHDCGEGVFGLSAGGTFEASLLLLDELWNQLAQQLPGEPLAAVPSRDLLFVVGSARANAHDLIAARARMELADKRYAISRSVLVRKGGTWCALGS